MKYLPTDLSTFSTMINGNYVYVDKTEHIYNLFGGGTRYYFLSRPRRFGKSLLISTLKELFQGNRVLFKGLWIDSSDYQWSKHPVVHLDFSALAHDSPEQLLQALSLKLQDIASDYGIDISNISIVHSQFSYLVKQLAKENKVVILIDEYDKPILDSIALTDKAILMRDTLKGIYDVIKSMDEHIRALFITGVTKFARTSIFSGLNNLQEITLNFKYNALLGYTPEELITYFKPYIDKLALEKKCSAEQLIEEMRRWYDGYQFAKTENGVRVYNPYSTLLFLANEEFSNYWFNSGTPTFLMEMIKKREFAIIDIDKVVATDQELGSFTIEKLPVKTLLFQTGYLTIDHYDEDAETYYLRIPNYEVRSSFFNYLLNSFTDVDLSSITDLILKIMQALTRHDVDSLCQSLQSFFASIPSIIQIPLERYYQTIFFILAKLIGLKTNVEVFTNIGRIDMVIEMADLVYVFEFKIRGSAQEALDQIEDKQYSQQYLTTHKSIVLVGVFFDINKRNIDSWVVKKL